MTASLHTSSALLAITLGAAACFLPDLELEGLQCPCAAGFTCDTATNTCVVGTGGSTSSSPTTGNLTGTGGNDGGGPVDPTSGPGAGNQGGSGHEGGFGPSTVGAGGDGSGGSPPPTEGSCEIPYDLVEGIGVVDTTVGKGNDMQGCISADGPDLVYALTAVQDGNHEITLYGQAELQVYVRSDCFDMASEIACQDQGGTNAIEVATVPLTAGQTVFVIVDGHSGEESDFTLDVAIVP